MFSYGPLEHEEMDKKLKTLISGHDRISANIMKYRIVLFERNNTAHLFYWFEKILDK